jgi:hypothetical protein
MGRRATPCPHAWRWLAATRIRNIEEIAGDGRSLL